VPLRERTDETPDGRDAGSGPLNRCFGHAARADPRHAAVHVYADRPRKESSSLAVTDEAH
jgi:hypothetical protein